jgi:hypothetical protein
VLDRRSAPSHPRVLCVYISLVQGLESVGILEVQLTGIGREVVEFFLVGGDGGGAVEPRCVGPFGLTAPRYRRTLGCHLRVCYQGGKIWP